MSIHMYNKMAANNLHAYDFLYGTLTIICSKYTQFLNLGFFVSVEDPPIAIPNLAKRILKRQAHKHIPCQCEDPPRAWFFCIFIEVNRLYL